MNNGKRISLVGIVVAVILAAVWWFSLPKELHFNQLSGVSGQGQSSQSSSESSSALEKQSLTRIRLVAELPYSELQKAAEREVPRVIEGYVDDPTPLGGDSLTWRVTRGGIGVGLKPGGGGIRLSTSLDAYLRLKWKIKALFTITNVTTGNVKASASVDLSPRLTPDWMVNPNISVQARVHQADINLAGVKVGVARHVQPELRRAAQKEADKLNGKIRSDTSLKIAVTQAWNKLCRKEVLNVSMPDRSKKSMPDRSKKEFYLVVKPKHLDMMQPHFDKDRARLGGQAEVVLSLQESDPGKLDCGSLPDNRLPSNLEDTGSFHVVLHGKLGWETVKSALEQTLDRESGVSLIKLAGYEDGRLRVTVGFELKLYEWISITKGTATALTRVELIDNELRFKDVVLGEPKNDDWLAGLVHPLLASRLSALAESARIDLTDLMTNFKDQLQTALKFLPSKVTLESLTLGSPQVFGDGLRISIETKGKVEPYPISL